MIFSLLSSPARREKFLFTKSWFDDLYAVVTHTGKDIAYTNVEDLKKYRGIVFQGVWLPDPFNAVRADDYDVIELSDIVSLYKTLRLGRADYIITPPLTYKRMLPAGYEWSDFNVVENSLVSIPLFMAVSKKSPYAGILDEINAKIEKYGKQLNTKSLTEIFSN